MVSKLVATLLVGMVLFAPSAIAAESAPKGHTIRIGANNLKFVKAYQAKYKNVPSHMAEGAYVCGMAINKAALALKGDIADESKFLSELRKTDLKDAPRGPVKLDAYNNPIENIYVFKVEKVNGHLANVPIDTIKNVSQFWKFKPEQVMKDPPFTKDYPPCKNCN